MEECSIIIFTAGKCFHFRHIYKITGLIIIGTLFLVLDFWSLGHIIYYSFAGFYWIVFSFNDRGHFLFWDPFTLINIEYPVIFEHWNFLDFFGSFVLFLVFFFKPFPENYFLGLFSFFD